MNYSTLVYLLVSCCLLLQANARSVGPTNEAEVVQYLQESSDRMFNILNELRDFTLPSDGEFYEDRVNISFFKEACDYAVEVAEKVKTFQNVPISDPIVKREIELLSGGADLCSLKGEYYDLLSALGNLENIARDSDICSYKNPDQCDLAFLPDIKKIISTSFDPRELQYYWDAWRDKNSGWAKTHFSLFIDAFKKAATLNGKSPLHEWYSVYDDANFLEELEDVMKQLAPFYSEIHAYIRNILHKKYGDLVISPTGCIPHHLIEQVLLHAWKLDGIIENPYAQKHLPDMEVHLESVGVKSRRAVEVADSFYRSIGFETQPREFWTKNLKKKLEDDGDCKSDVFDDTPDVSLKYCPKASYKSFLQLHGDFARIHYARQKAGLRYGVFYSYDFEYAVGEAAILSASTPKHTKRIGIISDYQYDPEVAMNRLFRLAMHTMFNLPQHFVHSKVIAEVLSDKISIDNINEHYWELMEKYAGIQPAMNRTKDDFDFPYKFYMDLDENHQTRKFVNEILGYQIYRSLCKKTGQFAKGNPNKPLQNCDFFGIREAGNTLKEMMKLGSTKRWQDVLAVIIEDEPDLNAAALLEYYEPVRNWLEGQNRINNVQFGWDKAQNRVLESAEN